METSPSLKHQQQSSLPGHNKTKSADADANPLHTRTVDTDVTTRTTAAITHEFVQPTVHEIFQKKITREIHKHHVYHRTLPLVQTEILPTRHFVESPDGTGRLVEASDDQVRQLTGRPTREWMAIPRSLTIGHRDGEQALHLPEDVPQPGHEPFEIQTEPILIDKKTHVTEDGTVRTEYLWRHPPVFEDIHGRTTPVLIPAGVSDEWRQISLNARRNKSTTRAAGDVASDVRINGSDRDGSTNNAARQARSDERSSSRRVGEPTSPAKSKPTAIPEHRGLSIRTVPKEPIATQSGRGSPNSTRRSSNMIQSVNGSPNSTRTSLPHQPWRY